MQAFLQRIWRRRGLADSDAAAREESDAQVLAAVEMLNGLECKISSQSAKSSYVLDTEDVLHRKRPRPQTEAIYTAKKQRRAPLPAFTPAASIAAPGARLAARCLAQSARLGLLTCCACGRPLPLQVQPVYRAGLPAVYPVAAGGAAGAAAAADDGGGHGSGRPDADGLLPWPAAHVGGTQARATETCPSDLGLPMIPDPHTVFSPPSLACGPSVSTGSTFFRPPPLSFAPSSPTDRSVRVSSIVPCSPTPTLAAIPQTDARSSGPFLTPSVPPLYPLSPRQRELRPASGGGRPYMGNRQATATTRRIPNRS